MRHRAPHAPPQSTSVSSPFCAPSEQLTDVGDLLGLTLGDSVGYAEGEALGLALGLTLGEMLGLALGLVVGDVDGDREGEMLGLSDGIRVEQIPSTVPVAEQSPVAS